MASVTDVVSQYLPGLRETGSGSLRARCPFCESQRAFMMSTETGLWKCWSCGESGTLLRFMRKVTGQTAGAERLLQDVRLVDTQRAGAQRAHSFSQMRWSTLPGSVLGAYRNPNPALEAAGFRADVLASWEVGFDSLEQRITFAIRDHLGRLVGVSGRATRPGQLPRYRIYDSAPAAKGRKPGAFRDVAPNYVPDVRKHLYGMHRFYAERYFSDESEFGPLVIVEGYKAAIWVDSADYKEGQKRPNVVALQGSVATDEQLRLLGRLRGPYYIFLDLEPGKQFPAENGACAAAALAKKLAPSGKVLICSYPQDAALRTAPDDLTPDAIQDAIQNATTTTRLKLTGEDHG